MNSYEKQPQPDWLRAVTDPEGLRRDQEREKRFLDAVKGLPLHRQTAQAELDENAKATGGEA